MSLSVPSFSSKCGHNVCPRLDPFQHQSNFKVKIIVGAGMIGTVAACCWSLPVGLICGVTLGVSYLTGRTLSYQYAKDHLLEESSLDRACDLKLSDHVRVVTFFNNAKEICDEVKLKRSDLIITKLESTIQRIEFTASQAQITNFLRFHQANRNKEIKYNLSPLYEHPLNSPVYSRDFAESKYRPFDSESSSSSSESSITLKVSPVLNLVVFCLPRIDLKISNIMRKHNVRLPYSQSIFTQDGFGRWEKLSKEKIPGKYESCRPITEKKITTEIQHDNFLDTLLAIATNHDYEEIGYDMRVLYEASTSPKASPHAHKYSALKNRISKFCTLFFSNKYTYPQLSDDVKFTIYAPRKIEDRVRKAIGQEGAGMIGDFAYCSFSSETLDATKTRIETVVAKKKLVPILSALNRCKEGNKEITCLIQPLFKRIDTEALRLMHHWYMRLYIRLSN